MVFLSAAAYAQDHRQATEEGASVCLDKPADLFRLDSVIVSLIWKTEARSLSAKAAEISAIREAIEEGCRELDELKATKHQAVLRAKEHLLRAQAYSAFIDSGGVKAHFERLWPGIRDEILADKTATAD